MKFRSCVVLLLAAGLAACAGTTETTTETDTPEVKGVPEHAEKMPEVHEHGGAGTTKVTTEAGPDVDVGYELIDGIPITEGDVIVPVDTLSATMVGRRWPSATVPYVVETDLPDTQRVTDAIAHWQSKTNVRFVSRTTQSNYVSFHPSTGCSSNIGLSGGKQTINLATGEVPSSVVGVAIERSSNRAYYFFRRGFATIGSTARVDAVQPHFKYNLPAGKAPTDVVEMAFTSAGHLVVWYTDGTTSEGTPVDFVRYKPPAPYALVAGKTPADVAAIAISKTDQTHVFYKDGTYTIGTTTRTDAVAAPTPFTVAAGKTPSQLAHVDVASNGAFWAFYSDGKTTSGTAASLGATTALAAVSYPGHCAVGQTIHEIGHAVGLFHEQTRQDRDRYVKILYENISSGQSYNFNKYSASSGRDTGPYDYDSVMHYGSYSFSSNGQPTILKLDGGTIAGQRASLSDGDIGALRGMYPTAPF